MKIVCLPPLLSEEKYCYNDMAVMLLGLDLYSTQIIQL